MKTLYQGQDDRSSAAESASAVPNRASFEAPPKSAFHGPFGGVLAALHEAIVLVDEAQQIVGFNPAAEALFACPAQAALGRPLAQFVPHEQREAHERQVQRFSQSAAQQRKLAPGRTITALRADGGEIPVEVTLSRVDTMVDGTMRHWFAALLRDLSTESALREDLDVMTRRLHAALEATPVAVWIAQDERIEYANRLAARLAGETAGNALKGRMLGSLLTAATLAALRSERALGAAVPALRVPGQLRRADGALREIEIMLAPLPDHGHAVEQMVIDDVTDQRRATAELERSGRTLRRLQASVVEAREEERRRIARELHDELGQRLTALKMDLSALAATPAAPGTVQGAAAAVPAMLGMLDETVAAVRRIASDLRPLMLDDLGLTAAIEWLARDLARRTGIEVAVQQQDLRDPPAEPLATALYRMVQEGLTNAVRHAKATRVEVALQEQGDAIVLTVSDNGVGLPEASAVRDDAFGLLGLRERAAMLGGTLTLEGHAAPGGGARLTVFLPLKRRNTGAKS